MFLVALNFASLYSTGIFLGIELNPEDDIEKKKTKQNKTIHVVITNQPAWQNKYFIE